jgi:hypothetical protein
MTCATGGGRQPEPEFRARVQARHQPVPRDRRVESGYAVPDRRFSPSRNVQERGRARRHCRDRTGVRARRGHARSAERHQRLAQPLSGRDQIWSPFLHLDGAAVAFARTEAAGANPLAAASRGRLAPPRVHRRWYAAVRCASRMPTNGCLSSPGRTAAATVVMSSGRWTMRLAVAASFCPDESIHDNLPGFTRLHSGRRAVESKQKHWVSFL